LLVPIHWYQYEQLAAQGLLTPGDDDLPPVDRVPYDPTLGARPRLRRSAPRSPLTDNGPLLPFDLQEDAMTHNLTLPSFDLTAYMLTFTVEALTPIEMGAYKGSALRGAWKGYLQTAYCTAPLSTRKDPLHQRICPVCYLTEHESGPESRRPYVFRPPLDGGRRYEPGERFTFGITLLGKAMVLLPYVLLAVREMGENNGIGRKGDGDRRRGRFRLVEVRVVHPFRRQVEVILAEGSTEVHMPSLSITAADIAAEADRLAPALQAGGALRLRLLTPVRLVYRPPDADRSRLMRRFDFGVFAQRLTERLFGLAVAHSRHPEGHTQEALRQAVHALQPLAAEVALRHDATHWWDVVGYSSRIGRTQPLGGLVGEVTLSGAALAPLLPLLLWGEVVQVGRNVVKGAGVYEVEADGQTQDRLPLLHSPAACSAPGSTTAEDAIPAAG